MRARALDSSSCVAGSAAAAAFAAAFYAHALGGRFRATTIAATLSAVIRQSFHLLVIC